MNNFVYAVDKNYNQQLFYSIFTLLENTNSFSNIHVIHKEPNTFVNYEKLLKNNFSNYSLNIYKFNILNINFPNLENKHVSEATYYRLFIDKIIPDNIKNYIYLDADIVVINNFDNYINEVFDQLNKSNLIAACRTEFTKNNLNFATFEKLKMKSSKYFNAGVMFVNHKKWLSTEMFAKLSHNLKSLKDVINYWDQDVLNSVIDGNYIEISQTANYPLNLRWPLPFEEIKQNNLFIHYQSNNKPWTIRGCANIGSLFYQNTALKLNGRYHLVKSVRRYDLFYLLLNTLKFKYLHLPKKLNFYKESLKLIFL